MRYWEMDINEYYDAVVDELFTEFGEEYFAALTEEGEEEEE